MQAVAGALTVALVERQATVADDLAVVGARAVRRAYAAWGRLAGALAAGEELRASGRAWRDHAAASLRVAEAVERQGGIAGEYVRRAVAEFAKAAGDVAVASGRAGEVVRTWGGLLRVLGFWPADWEEWERARERTYQRLAGLLPDAARSWSRLLGAA